MGAMGAMRTWGSIGGMEESARNTKGRVSGGIPDSGRARVRELECKMGRTTGGSGQTVIGSCGMSADEKVVTGLGAHEVRLTGWRLEVLDNGHPPEVDHVVTEKRKRQRKSDKR